MERKRCLCRFPTVAFYARHARSSCGDAADSATHLSALPSALSACDYPAACSVVYGYIGETSNQEKVRSTLRCMACKTSYIYRTNIYAGVARAPFWQADYPVARGQ